MGVVLAVFSSGSFLYAEVVAVDGIVEIIAASNTVMTPGIVDLEQNWGRLC